MNYVFDSSSLIYLGKVKLLEKIVLLPGERFIPQEVYDEVLIKGSKRNEPEISYIGELIKKRQFVIRNTGINVTNDPLLSDADKEVLSLAKETKSIAIIDENYAKHLAKSLNIKSHGSLYVLILLVKKKIITKKQAVNYLNKMIKLGFYLSIDKYKDVMRILEK